MCHVLKCDYEAIKQFLDSMELDPGKLMMFLQIEFRASAQCHYP